MKSIKKMFDVYAKSPDMELEELERSVLEEIARPHKLYMATVPTYYEVYAIADTEERAKRLALTKALKFLKQREAEFDGKRYTNCKQVDEQLGCNVYEFPGINTAIIE